MYIAFVPSNEQYISSMTRELLGTHCFRCLQLFTHMGGPLTAKNCILKVSLRREINYFCNNSDGSLRECTEDRSNFYPRNVRHTLFSMSVVVHTYGRPTNSLKLWCAATHQSHICLYPGQSRYVPLRGVQLAITRCTLNPTKPVYAELPLHVGMLCPATPDQ